MEPSFTEVQVEVKDTIGYITLNRPKKLNAISHTMFFEIKRAFEHLGNNDDVRVVLIRGEGKAFTAGLDLMDAATNIFGGIQEGKDVGRKAIVAHKVIFDLQDCMTAAEKCRVPVIAAVHGYCIGAGIDLTSACDIRLATSDAKFTVRETDIGMAADIGTLQRFPKVVGDQSWVREVCYTA